MLNIINCLFTKLLYLLTPREYHSYFIKKQIKNVNDQIKFILKKYQKNQHPTTKELICDLKTLKHLINSLYYATDGAIEPLYSEVIEYIDDTIKLLEKQSKALSYNINGKTHYYHFYK